MRRLASTVALAVILALGACGDDPGAPAGAPTEPASTAGAPTARADDAARLAATEELLGRLSVATTGSAADSYAFGLLRYERYELGLAACMADAGQTYTPRRLPPFQPPAEGWPDALRLFDATRRTDVAAAAARGLGFADALAARGAWRERVGPDAAPGSATLAAAGRRRYRAAYDACLDDLGVMVSDERDAPILNRPLYDALYVAVADVIGRPELEALRQGYGPCMAAAGYPAVTDGDSLFRAAHGLFGAFDATPQTSSAAWRAARDAERRLAVADARCRAELHRAALVALEPVLARFVRDHEAEIEQSVALSADLRARAAAVADRVPGLVATAATLRRG